MQVFEKIITVSSDDIDYLNHVTISNTLNGYNKLLMNIGIH